jgi:hypothetical protein
VNRCFCFSSLLGVAFQIATASAVSVRADEQSEFYDPVKKTIEGWTVSVDPDLLRPEHEHEGSRALTALANHLQRITYILPPDRLAQLQELPIWIELHNEKLTNMQYHPSREWLTSHGHDPRLAKHVHIPRARNLTARNMWAKHPYVVLHELAHAYHDQVLSFNNKRIIEAFRAAKKKGDYEKVLLFTGQEVRHYAMTDHKEYFAEATEAYLGVNDFYPFVRAELKQHDPFLFQLLQEIWGQL